MPTEQDVKDYLGIDYEDAATNRRIAQLIAAADKYLIGSLGAGYPRDDPRVRELALLVIADLYDNTELAPKEEQQIRRIVESMSLQLRLEMRSDGGQEWFTNEKSILKN